MHGHSLRHLTWALAATAPLLPSLLHAQPPSKTQDVTFVRQGVVLKGETQAAVWKEGQEVKTQAKAWPTGVWLGFEWEPRVEYEIGKNKDRRKVRAPIKPTPWMVEKIELEDVGQPAGAGVAPDAVVKFDPASERVAVGTYGGWLRVKTVGEKGWTFERKIGQGMVKRLAWAGDGRTLFVGEQSPEAGLSAVDPTTGEPRWTVRLAEFVETSHAPQGDVYGRYTLPAAFDLHVTTDDRLLVAAAHSWNTTDGLRNRSVVLCFDSAGRLLWRFPAQSAAPVVVSSLGVDPSGGRVAFFAQQSQKPEPTLAADSADIEPGALTLIDGRTGRRLAVKKFAPEPHFQRAESWDSTAVSPTGDRTAIGLSDGRAFLLTGDDLTELRRLDLGRTLDVAGVPIVSACSYTRFHGPWLCFQTQNTHIPFGSSLTAQQPPSPHRGANTLTVTDSTGRLAWLYHGPYSLSGTWSDRSGPSGSPRYLLTTCRELPGSPEPGPFGALLFALSPSPSSGLRRLLYHYPTIGPVFSHADLSPTGLYIALIEVPHLPPGSLDLVGTHSLHIVH